MAPIFTEKLDPGELNYYPTRTVRGKPGPVIAAETRSQAAQILTRLNFRYRLSGWAESPYVSRPLRVTTFRAGGVAYCGPYLQPNTPDAVINVFRQTYPDLQLDV